MSPISSRWKRLATGVAGLGLTVLVLSGGGLLDTPQAELLGGPITCCSK